MPLLELSLKTKHDTVCRAREQDSHKVGVLEV
jgi:hypothetical protein